MPQISIKKLKSQAKEYQKNTGIKYNQALEKASIDNGFNSYHQARKVINNGYFKVYFPIQENLIIDLASYSHLITLQEEEFYQSLYSHQIPDNSIDIDSFYSYFDGLSFFKLNSKEIKDFQRAERKIQEIIKAPPLFLIHNYEFIDLNTYETTKYDSITSYKLISQRQHFTGETPEDTPYLWCLHCERAYKNGSYRTIEQAGEIYEMCPYDDCNGDAVIDSWSWDQVRASNPSYPKTPEHDIRYPLYGEKK